MLQSKSNEYAKSSKLCNELRQTAMSYASNHEIIHHV